MAAAVAAFFVLGAVAGSFVSVVAYRLPRGESIISPRSPCPSCGAQIAAYDGVPIVSWLLLLGRCRRCGAAIPVRDPLVELALGLAFAATAVVLWDDPPELALGLVFLTILAAVTLTDLEHRVIPNRVVLTGTVIGCAIVVAALPETLVDRAIAAGAAGGFLLLVTLVHPAGMGMGDVKLAALMGLYLGRAIAPALLVAFAAGALVGVVLIVRHGKRARKRAVPFGPFLALGGLVGLLAGDEMVDWYLDDFAAG